jgi:ATP-dependent DNA ligase
VEGLDCVVRIGDSIAKLPTELKERARKRPQPSWIAPMLTTLVDEPFSRQDWIFEPKLDGEMPGLP